MRYANIKTTNRITKIQDEIGIFNIPQARAEEANMPVY